MEREVVVETRFKSDWKKLQKKHYSYDLMDVVIKMLVMGEPLPGKYKDHSLLGNFKGFRECHIKPDWLLIYKVTDVELILIATGSHDDLFK